MPKVHVEFAPGFFDLALGNGLTSDSMPSIRGFCFRDAAWASLRLSGTEAQARRRYKRGNLLCNLVSPAAGSPVPLDKKRAPRTIQSVSPLRLSSRSSKLGPLLVL